MDFKMQNNKREWVISPEQKLEIFESYFCYLYSTDSPIRANMEAFFLNLVLPILSPDQVETLNTPITLMEIMVSIDAPKHNKALGPVVLTLEFFKIFKTLLAPI